MNVVDSSGWLEFFTDGPNATAFSVPLTNVDDLIVPSITIYEVFKVLLRESGENAALQGMAAMQQGKAIDLTPSLAASAARLSVGHTLPMADSIILATARFCEATLWTQDVDFDGLPDVRYFPRK